MSPFSPPRAGTVKVVIVSGKPATGKSTYVRRHMRRGDLVVDWDLLWSALSGMRGKPEQLVPFLASARDAIYARLERPASGVGTAWIIVTAEEDAERLEVRFVGQRIHLEIEESVRQERLAKRA